MDRNGPTCVKLEELATGHARGIKRRARSLCPGWCLVMNFGAPHSWGCPQSRLAWEARRGWPQVVRSCPYAHRIVCSTPPGELLGRKKPEVYRVITQRACLLGWNLHPPFCPCDLNLLVLVLTPGASRARVICFPHHRCSETAVLLGSPQAVRPLSFIHSSWRLLSKPFSNLPHLPSDTFHPTIGWIAEGCHLDDRSKGLRRRWYNSLFNICISNYQT